tara:strand:- start:1302 stop:1424 length:123 start_codon:yes stop_codon:yes gene_type:complete
VNRRLPLSQLMPDEEGLGQEVFADIISRKNEKIIFFLLLM